MKNANIDMRRPGLLLLLCATLGGCAQPATRANEAPAPVPQGSEEAPPGADVLLMNQKGGFYSYFETAVEPEKNVDIELTMVRTNPHPTWGPMATVCTVLTDWKLRTCFRFTTAGNGPEIELHRLIEMENKRVGDLEALPGTFHVGEPVHISVRNANDRIAFTVNGVTHAYATSAAADRIALSCSSASCRVQVTEE